MNKEEKLAMKAAKKAAKESKKASKQHLVEETTTDVKTVVVKKDASKTLSSF